MTPKISFCTLLDTYSVIYFQKVFINNIKNINHFHNAEWLIGIPQEIFSDPLINYVLSTTEHNINLQLISIDNSRNSKQVSPINHLAELSNGDLIFNCPPEYYLNENLENYILKQFNKDHNIIIRGDIHGINYFIRSALKIFCIKREDFLKIKGIKEEIVGFNEILFGNKLIKKLFRNEIVLTNEEFLKFESWQFNPSFEKNLFGVFIKLDSYQQSQLIILYKNGTYKLGKLIKDPYLYFEAFLENAKWEEGIYNLSNDEITIGQLKYRIEENRITSELDIFSKIESNKLLGNLFENLDLITNYLKFIKIRQIN